jgi:sugar lactone lactonase YvrE
MHTDLTPNTVPIPTPPRPDTRSSPARPAPSRRRRARAVGLVGLVGLAALALPLGASAASSGDITTFAGNGSDTHSGNGGPATEAGVVAPIDVAFDLDGNAYIAARNEGDIRKVAPDGTISLFIDGYQAPSAIAYDAVSNSLFVASENDRAVYKIAMDGTPSLFAGTGTEGYNGDGMAATSAQLNFPRGVAVDMSGNVFIADTGNNRVREVTTDGIIHTVAGDGSTGSSGDGGAATDAHVEQPWAIIVDGSGVVRFTESTDCRIRSFTVGGSISAFAGTGSCSSSGDGGPALSAGFGGAVGIALAPDGSVYVGEFQHRVRRIGPDGNISTVAGTGTSGFSGDGGPAIDAELNFPKGIALGPDGRLYVADYANNRVRAFEVTASPVTTPTTPGPTTVPAAAAPTAVAADPAVTG